MKQKIIKLILLFLSNLISIVFSYICVAQNQPVEIYRFEEKDFPIEEIEKSNETTFVIYADEITINKPIQLFQKKNIVIFANKINIDNDFILCVSNFCGVNSNFPSRPHGGSSPYESFIYDDIKCIDFKKQNPLWWSGDLVLSAREINFNKNSVVSLNVGSYEALDGVPMPSDYYFANIYRNRLKSYCVIASDKLNFSKDFDSNFYNYVINKIIFELSTFLSSRGWITTNKNIARQTLNSGEIFWLADVNSSYIYDMKQIFLQHYGLDLSDQTISYDSRYSYEYFVSHLKPILSNSLLSIYVKDRKKFFNMFPFGVDDNRSKISQSSPILNYEKEVFKYKQSSIDDALFTESGINLDRNTTRNIDYNVFSSTTRGVRFYYSKWVVSYLGDLYQRFNEMKLADDENGKSLIYEKIKNLKPTYNIDNALKDRYNSQITKIQSIKTEFINSYIVRKINVSVKGNTEELKVFSYQNPGNYYLLPNRLAIQPINIAGKDYLGTIQLTNHGQSFVSFNAILMSDRFRSYLAESALKVENSKFSVVPIPKGQKLKFLGISSGNSGIPLGILSPSTTIQTDGSLVQCQIAIDDNISAIFWNNLLGGALKLKFALQLPEKPNIVQEFDLPIKISNINSLFNLVVENGSLQNNCPFGIYVDYRLCKSKFETIDKFVASKKSISISPCTDLQIPYESISYIPQGGKETTDLFYQFTSDETRSNKYIVLENLIGSKDPLYDKQINYLRLTVKIDDEHIYVIDKLFPNPSDESSRKLNFFRLKSGKIKINLSGNAVYTDGSVRRLKDKSLEAFDKSTISLTFNDLQ